MTDNSAAASEQRDVPYLRLEFDHVALVLRALPELSLTAAAEQLRRTMACMLQELPRGPAGAAVPSRPRAAGGGAAESPPPPPSDDELALALDARVESWQAFVRCAQHLAAQVRARGGGGGAGGGAGASAGGGADSDAAAGRRRAGHRRGAGQRAAAAARRGARAAVGDARRRGAAAPRGL